MLVNIFWSFNVVGGGGNQFLNTLKRYLIDNEVYTEDPNRADVLLVNSKDRLDEASLFKDKTIIHRIDGIFSLYRGEESRPIDVKVYDFARKHADGIIFQSDWSMHASKRNGMSTSPNEIIIRNCADGDIFDRNDRKEKIGNKIRLITASWSSNWKKGFKIYEYLDKKLDFNVFEYVFIGRSPVNFRSITMLGIKTPRELSKELRESDIFITASEDDACSNALIEALSCGLPVLGLKSGGNTEIIGENNGSLFSGEGDIIENLKVVTSKVVNNLYNIRVDTIEQVGKKYYDFMEGIHRAKH